MVSRPLHKDLSEVLCFSDDSRKQVRNGEIDKMEISGESMYNEQATSVSNQDPSLVGSL